MGTNYYWHQKPDCECCGREFDAIHIGKSSAGWCFSLHVMPDEGVITLDDWRLLWATPGSYIRNEYDEHVSIADMENIITERGIERDWDNARWWQGSYSSEQDFHKRNYSERGPQGLLRHSIGPHCKAHGKGTWDCITGEFS